LIESNNTGRDAEKYHDGRDRISNFVREPGSQPTDAREALAPNEMGLRFGESLRRGHEGGKAAMTVHPDVIALCDHFIASQMAKVWTPSGLSVAEDRQHFARGLRHRTFLITQFDNRSRKPLVQVVAALSGLRCHLCGALRRFRFRCIRLAICKQDVCKQPREVWLHDHSPETPATNSCS